MDAALEYVESLWAEPWARSLIIALGSIVGAWLIEVVVCRFLAYAARRTRTDLDDKIIEILKRPIFMSVLLYGLALALEPAGPPARLLFVTYGLFKTLAVLLWAAAAFNTGHLLLSAVSARARKNAILQKRTLPVFELVLKAFILGVAIYFLFLAWNIDVTAWLASAGIIGVAVGFAAQDTLANLFAGIFIIADAPYKIGDYIVLDNGSRGRVTKIGMRSTRILTLDDVEVTVPNSVIGGSQIVNEAGGPNLKQRVAVQVDAAYGADVDKVREVLLECAEGVEGISSHPKPVTRFKAFGASGLGFALQVWIDEPRQKDAILDVLHERVYKAFNANNLEIPFSKHDLYVKEFPRSGESHAN